MPWCHLISEDNFIYCHLSVLMVLLKVTVIVYGVHIHM